MPTPFFMVSVKTDTASFKATLRGLMEETRYNTIPKVLRHMAGIWVKDVIRFTPPRGRNPYSESWPQQKAMGMAAVARDIGRVFWSLYGWLPAAFAGQQNRIKEWRKAISSGDAGLITTLLGIVNVPNRGVVPAPTQELHDSAKRGGEVPKGFTPPYYVPQKGNIQSYIRAVQRRVGEWKHGWMAAVDGLKVRGIPEWVKNQRSDAGTFIDQSEHPKEAFVQMENRSAGTAYGLASKILGPPSHALEGKLKKELERVLQYAFSKASGR